MVLLSGGQDSVCLLDAVVTAAPVGAVYALHVNYQLRQQADSDQRLCEELCERLGVPLKVVRADPDGRRGNLQAWARELRYAEAQQLADRVAAAHILTAHTATDQVETFIYRLATSPGRNALMAMRPSSRGGTLLRPLLAVTREQTAAYCKQRGLKWAEDHTNLDPVYARGRVRGQIVPQLRQLSPVAERNILKTVEQLQAEQPLLNQLADQVIDQQQDEAVTAQQLKPLPPALRALVITRFAERTLGLIPPTLYGRAEEIYLMLLKPGSSSLDLSAELRACSEYGTLTFSATGPEAASETAVVSLPVPGRANFAGYGVTTEVVAPQRLPDCIDLELLGDRKLTLRHWRHGDRIQPLGMDGSKSLQDIFVDRRIPRQLRARLPLVEAAGELICIPGVTINHNLRITDSTSRALRITREDEEAPKNWLSA